MEKQVNPDRRYNDAVLGLGSNINPGYNLLKAVEFLKYEINITAVSSVWETLPVGTLGPKFLNAAVLVSTQLSPKQIKYQVTRPIEIKLGRVRTPDKNAPRTIDIDLLIWGNQIYDSDLLEQAHIAIPASEICPDFIPQNFRESLSTIAEKLTESTPLVKCKDIQLSI